MKIWTRQSPLTTPAEGTPGAARGYAGWSGGQLERELVEKSWVILPPTADLLLPVKTQEEGSARWRAIMKRLGPMYHLMAQAPDELGLN